jgi:hypothetical protein
MKVWILECDHKPISDMPVFLTDQKETRRMKAMLNRFPTDDEHYYDAVLYERIKPKQNSSTGVLQA